ncbi:hypothetical protein DFH28DRAFT_961090 [Melampsora americana]|nr:hypothetical protein DFH28DRAFT_961090 [Melampsora americana]
MTERLTARERMTWDNLLDLEPIEISRQAKTLFQKAQTKLSIGSGHVITGISGNDRALACLCLLLVKSRLSPTEKKEIETALQRRSGVAPKLFSNAAKQLSSVLVPSHSHERTRRRREPMEESSTESHDYLDWGTLLDHEPEELIKKSKKLFKQINSTLQDADNRVVGLNGNRRAVACLSLYLAKSNKQNDSSGELEKHLYRLSGVTSRIFSQAIQQLREILRLAPSSPTKQGVRPDQDLTSTVSPSGSMGKRKRDLTDGGRAEALEGLMKSPTKRTHLDSTITSESDSIFSPTSSKRPQPSPFPSSQARPKRTQPSSPLKPNRHRTIEKTPLNLPVRQAPIKPMCIFESRLISNPEHRTLQSNLISFDDWNWKSNLLDLDWNESDFIKWEKWIQKSIVTNN